MSHPRNDRGWSVIVAFTVALNVAALCPSQQFFHVLLGQYSVLNGG